MKSSHRAPWKILNFAINAICWGYQKWRIRFSVTPKRVLTNFGKRSFRSFNNLSDIIKSKACEKQLISFDIFDTLLIRPFETPEDLFWFIEQVENSHDFAQQRVRAEKEARRAHSEYEDITLDEIYELIHPRYQEMKVKELYWEKKLIRCNPFLGNIVEDLTKSGLTCVAVSDMYLDKSFIQNLLEKNGIKGLAHIYVSSDYRLTKASGNLFKQVLRDYEISPAKMLHVGDNPISDVLIANSLGIDSCQVELITQEKDFQVNLAWRADIANIRKICASVHNALFYRHNFPNVYIRLGFYLGGPLALGYINFILQEALACKLDHLMFVARDGWILQRLFKANFSASQISSSYVYLNRRVGINGLMNWSDTPKYLKTLLQDASSEIDINVHDDYNANLREFDLHYEELTKWSAELRKELFNHVASCTGKHVAIGLVDTTTGAFSSYNFAKQILGERLKLAIYTGSYVDKNKKDYSKYFDENFTTLDISLVKLIEILLSSPEKPIVSLRNGLPVYGEPEGERALMYLQIAKGIELYFDEIFEMFGEYYKHILFSSEEWRALANCLIDNLAEEDVKAFETTMFGAEANNNQSLRSIAEIFGKRV